ncbi:MAG: SDR family NAD(P)-dependent oxidoreductase, partial [Opitutales bacterium]
MVLITGAYKGLGAETSRQLAAAGFHVVITARQVDKAQPTAS